MWINFAATFALLGLAVGLENGLGRVPQMGYNSWYDLMGDLNEQNLRETVDAMVSLGLTKLGYIYVNLDDCWAGGRNPDGTLFAEEAKFPSRSLRPLADYVHSKGMLFGTYTDRGMRTCAGRPGAQDHEAQDAATYASWTVDYLKEDSCNATQDHQTAFEQYGKMRDGLNRTGRPIFFSLCGWNPWYAPVGKTLGNSWRIGPDDTNWAGVLRNIDINAGLAQYAGPGGWNDPCLLLAEDEKGNQRMTELQTRAQFSMWAIMASPLLISANVRKMSPMNIETYLNAEVVAVNQDPLGMQGQRVSGGSLASLKDQPALLSTCDPADEMQKWVVSDGSKAPAQYWYNAKSNLCLNVADCQTGLILYPCVKDGCQNNKGFFFNVTNGHLVSAFGTCVQDEGPSGLDLAQCGSGSNQQWTYDTSSQQLRTAQGGRCLTAAAPGATNVWARPLSNGEYAVAFLNTGPTPADITCDATCLRAAGFYGKQATYRDLWLHQEMGTFTATNFTAKQVAAAGGIALYRVRPLN